MKSTEVLAKPSAHVVSGCFYNVGFEGSVGSDVSNAFAFDDCLEDTCGVV